MYFTRRTTLYTATNTKQLEKRHESVSRALQALSTADGTRIALVLLERQLHSFLDVVLALSQRGLGSPIAIPSTSIGATPLPLRPLPLLPWRHRGGRTVMGCQTTNSVLQLLWVDAGGA